MSCYLSSLFKAEDSQGYAKLANEGIMVGFPVKINGQSHREDNGIGYHSTVKFFDPSKDHLHSIHQIAQHLKLNPPDAKNTQIEPGMFKDRNGNDVYVLKLKGNSADKLKEHNGKFAHMGNPQPYAFEPHISVPKSVHDQVKASGAKTAHEAGIEFGHAELKRGPKTIKTYHHSHDTTEPAVPDESDLTSKVSVESKMPKLAASEKNTLCDLHKAEEKLVPLMKPFVSEAQRRWGNSPAGKKALGGEAGVHEWNEATKGKELPEKVSKAEDLIPSPSKDTYKELTLHHGTKSPSSFEHFDMKHHASGFYPGIYTSSDPKETEKHGTPMKVGFKGHLFEFKDSKHANQLHEHAGGGGSGHKLVQKLKGAGYHGIKRGSEHIIFDPENAKIEKSEVLLEKGALKNAGIALGMAGALAGGTHTADAENRAPASIQHLNPKAPSYDHNKMLRAIAAVESSGGKNTKHAAGGGAIHGAEHAYGSYGLMPETIRETIKGHKDLSAKHGKALALKGQQLHRYMQDHKGLEDTIADRHLSHMEHKLGQNPDYLAHSWLNGIQGTLNAKNKGQDIKNHWHVQKVRDAYSKVK